MTGPGRKVLRLKALLRRVHPAVWRRVGLADDLSIADLHRVIQILMGWDDDHPHRFGSHGRDYGVAYVGGPTFGEDAAAVRVGRFGFRPAERFLHEYVFTAGWEIEVRVERAIAAASSADHRIRVCVAGRHAGPPDGCGAPRVYGERRRDDAGWLLADDVDAVVAVLRRVGEGDATVLDDCEERGDFERAVSRLKAREGLFDEGFSRAASNAALRQAFTAARGSP